MSWGWNLGKHPRTPALHLPNFSMTSESDSKWKESRWSRPASLAQAGAVSLKEADGSGGSLPSEMAFDWLPRCPLRAWHLTGNRSVSCPGWVCVTPTSRIFKLKEFVLRALFLVHSRHLRASQLFLPNRAGHGFLSVLGTGESCLWDQTQRGAQGCRPLDSSADPRSSRSGQQLALTCVSSSPTPSDN